MDDEAPFAGDAARADRALAGHFGRELARVPDRPMPVFRSPPPMRRTLATLAAAAASIALAFALGRGAASVPAAAEYMKIGAALQGVDVPAALGRAVINANAAVAALYTQGGSQ